MEILAPVRQNFVTAHTHDFNSVLLDVTSYWDKIILQGQRFSKYSTSHMKPVFPWGNYMEIKIQIL